MTEEAKGVIAQPATEAKGLSLKVVALPSPSLAFSNVVFVSEATLKQLRSGYVQLDQRAIFVVGSNAFVKDDEIALNAFQRDAFAQNLHRQVRCEPYDGMGSAWIDTAHVKLELLSPFKSVRIQDLQMTQDILDRYDGHSFEKQQSLVMEHQGRVWKATFTEITLRSGHGPDPHPVQGDHGLWVSNHSKATLSIERHKCIVVDADQADTR